MPVDGSATARPQALQALASLGLWKKLSVGECVCDVESWEPRRACWDQAQTHTGASCLQLSQKPQPLQSLVHKTSLLWSAPAREKRYWAWKITGKKNNYCIKGCSIKVNWGIFRLRGQREAGITTGVIHVLRPIIFPLPFHLVLINGHTWILS